LTDEQLSVLVVTDSSQVRSELKYGMPVDVAVSFAGDSREAMAAMSERAPSAVVVDLQTGSAGGYALARDMGFDDRLAHVPIVMLLERDQDAWLARQAGASFFRIKPVEAVRLFTDLRELVSP
jgi:two-component system, OmpR family, phosphate regulon response regulator PhoB